MRLLVLLPLVCSCADPDLEPIESVVGAAAPIGFAATHAMRAMAGDAAPCTEVRQACAGDAACAGEVAIALGPDCPLPLGGEGEGTVLVDGTWTGSSAVLAARFEDVTVGGRATKLRAIEAFVVDADDDGVQVAYAIQDVALARGALGDETADDDPDVGQSAWTIEVVLGATRADDAYTIDGASQVIVDDDVKQVAVARAVLDPACRDNPIEGTATMNDVGEDLGGATVVSFHAACDGAAELQVSVGASAARSQSDVTLDFFE